jgi:hypothetical protein
MIDDSTSINEQWMKLQIKGEILWKHGKENGMLTSDMETRLGLWSGWNQLTRASDKELLILFFGFPRSNNIYT